MRTHPYCKINLGLHVVGKRPDGYHDIETVFLPVRAMTDTLEITESDHPMMVQEGIELDNAPEENICMRAWQMLHERYGVPPVTIRLRKGIPFGAGLGGGSSDGASTLKLLNRRYLRLSMPVLRELAAELGSDCPFFLQSRTAYATGKGECLTRLDHDIALSGYRIVIEMPKGEHVSTREAYEGLDKHLSHRSRPSLLEVIRQPIEEWRNTLVNDFETSVFPSHPAIAELKDDLYRRGAVYASMTGSGAAVYGIFKKVN